VNSFKAICEKSQKILVELFRSSNETEDEINEQINYPIEQYTTQEEINYVDELAVVGNEQSSKFTTNFEFLSLNNSTNNDLLEITDESTIQLPPLENPICDIDDTKLENQTTDNCNYQVTSEPNKGQIIKEVCPKCGKKFAIHQLEAHQAEGTCTNKSIPECPICKKTFKSISNRNTHLNSHNDGELKFKYRE
jgi:UDP-N-acetylglucosamine 2-epimerase